MNEPEIKKICIALLGSAAKHYKQIKEGSHNMWYLIGRVDAYLNTARLLCPASGMEESSYGPILKDLEAKMNLVGKEAREVDDMLIKPIEEDKRTVLLTTEGVRRV